MRICSLFPCVCAYACLNKGRPSSASVMQRRPASCVAMRTMTVPTCTLIEEVSEHADIPQCQQHVILLHCQGHTPTTRSPAAGHPQQPLIVQRAAHLDELAFAGGPEPHLPR